MKTWDWRHNHPPLGEEDLLATAFFGFTSFCFLSANWSEEQCATSKLFSSTKSVRYDLTCAPQGCAGRGFCIIYSVLELEPDLTLVFAQLKAVEVGAKPSQ